MTQHTVVPELMQLDTRLGGQVTITEMGEAVLTFVEQMTDAESTVPTIYAFAEKLPQIVAGENRVSADEDQAYADLLIVPGIIDREQLRVEEIEGQFAEWLFDLSPRTHPYALTGGPEALRLEILSLSPPPASERNSPAVPVLCSVLVSAVLEMVRTHRLRFNWDIHMDDELRARRGATESLKDLKLWVDNYFDKQKSPVWEAVKQFVYFASSRSLGKARLFRFFLPELCTKKPSASALRRRCVILA